jgi:serine/threonine protein kinase
MNHFVPKISNLHADILQTTELGQLCGTKHLFRDRYEVMRILGRGGFGVTFLARNTSLPGSPLCVIKQLCPKVTNPKSWERACNRFEKEAKTLGQLGSHSQIPLLLDYFQGNGEFYLVQEYVRGCTIARDIRRNGPKCEGTVKQFLREILPVLQYVHKHRVIHRDIKPHNLLRCEDDGRLVLIDFGAVKERLAEAVEDNLQKTATTNFVGTMGFAPPEQFALRPVYGSDIYAVGVTCLFLLTGKGPLEFDHDPETGEISWQKEIELSENFAHILGKMVKISLEERFATVEDVMWALGMERYLPTLTNCLATKRLGDHRTNSQENFPGYIPPIGRTAIAIREWRAKLQVAKSRSKLKHYLPQVSN